MAIISIKEALEYHYVWMLMLHHESYEELHSEQKLAILVNLYRLAEEAEAMKIFAEAYRDDMLVLWNGLLHSSFSFEELIGLLSSETAFDNYLNTLIPSKYADEGVFWSAVSSADTSFIASHTSLESFLEGVTTYTIKPFDCMILAYEYDDLLAWINDTYPELLTNYDNI